MTNEYNRDSETTLVADTASSFYGSSADSISLLPIEAKIYQKYQYLDTDSTDHIPDLDDGFDDDDDEEEDNENRRPVNFHDLYAFDCNDKPVFFHSFIGKLVLVANVATQCGASYQLRQFEALYQKYKDRGFVILAFPSNQFHQEKKGTNKEVADNCRRKFDVTFPIMEKVKVNGKDQSEVFKFLKNSKHGFLNTKRVKWNFEKFLVGRDGTILKRYSTIENVKRKIEKDLIEIFKEEDKEKVTELEPMKSRIQRVVYI